MTDQLPQLKRIRGGHLAFVTKLLNKSKALLDDKTNEGDEDVLTTLLSSKLMLNE